MERLDFCSFVVTLRRYIYADALGNQLDLLCLLFGSFLQSTDAEDFTFDNGQVCRWLNGTARVSPKITSFYLVGENQEKTDAGHGNKNTYHYVGPRNGSAERV